MSTTVVNVMIVILIIVLNLVSAKMLSNCLNPRENLFEVWAPRVSLVPPFGIIGLLLGVLVIAVTLVWWTIQDIWE